MTECFKKPINPAFKKKRFSRLITFGKHYISLHVSVLQLNNSGKDKKNVKINCFVL